MSNRLFLAALTGVSLCALSVAPAMAQISGPYNAEFTAAGEGIKKDAPTVKLAPGSAFTISAWIKPSEGATGKTLIAGVGDAASGWFLTRSGDAPGFSAPGIDLVGKTALKTGAWTYVVATSDGRSTQLYADGRLVASSTSAPTTAPSPVVRLAPRGQGTAFAGRVAGLTVSAAATTAQGAKPGAVPNDSLMAFEPGSPSWPVQVRQMYGQVTPQDAWTLPQPKTAPDAPVAIPAYNGPAVVDGVIKAWRLQAAPQVSATPRQISTPGFNAGAWYVATTPGTVLTTLVDRGVYASPEHGLNNLTIPESLNTQDYWYRSEFAVPADYRAGRHLFVTFKGINYAAEVWINGQRVGGIAGAFIRGQFDISPYVTAGQPIAIAVRVSPPPHPGLAQEESLSAGPGDNGGSIGLDGPTFAATEGWDWIPSVRDRNTGLWQDVTLKTVGDLRLGDAQVITALPRTTATKIDNSKADITLNIPVSNLSAAPVTARVEATISDKAGERAPIVVARDITLAPGATTVSFTPKDFAALVVANPKLWWPNGYGAADLHNLHVTVSAAGAVSDQSDTRFGIRQVTYELSLVDPSGHLNRVEANFTRGHDLGIRITDGRHEAIHQLADVPGMNGSAWATGLRAEAQGSAAVTPLADASLSPYLVIRVNGVRIAARGGNWGMDDFMKRVGRDRLEPYFRLHRDAHINIIRNWVGQNTEDAFYDLADEYGLMVLNDFWESTQDYNVEAQDVPLFVANAKDVVDRYRNHPSIVAWFGRNEGMPQPLLNEALENLVYTDDGTRWYTGSSNRVNLQNSGPYAFKAPADYFTTYARGFSVESGTPSFPTREAFEAAVPAADRWPISDAWAYHDWHSQGNGLTRPFEDALTTEFGAATSLADFDRKAQMLNYESHRAIFEGMNAGLWTVNSGRLLWMTQPAWPSTMWQILSHDYDTQASFYGVKSAAEPVHVQMNLPDRKVIVVNNPVTAVNGATVSVEVYAIDGRQLLKAAKPVSVAGVAISPGMDFGIDALVTANKAVIIRLGLTDADGNELSHNVYWQAVDEASLQALNGLAPQALKVTADLPHVRADRRVSVKLDNPSDKPVLEIKLTLVDDKGNRILPAYYSDNYVSLMPGESRSVDIDYTADTAPSVEVRGWNVRPQTVKP